MVVLAAIFGSEGGASARVLRAVATGEARLAISDEGLRELLRVARYEEFRREAAAPVRALEIGLEIGLMGRLYHPPRHDWPTLPDPKDHWVLDLAFEAGLRESRTPYIVTLDKHFLDRAEELEAMGFRVLTPPQLLDSMRRKDLL